VADAESGDNPLFLDCLEARHAAYRVNQATREWMTVLLIRADCMPRRWAWRWTS
jgi:hypothetical protein